MLKLCHRVEAINQSARFRKLAKNMIKDLLHTKMSILSVHNCYLLYGGEDESRRVEERMLQKMGHQVGIYEEDNQRIATINSIQMALKTTWSIESYRILKEKLNHQPQDIVHVQNFFPLISPSVYYAAKEVGVPVVQTLRNYRLLCPNALFFRQGKVCEDCLGKFLPLPGVLHGCYKESRMATAAVAAMLSIHRTVGTWAEMVDTYIALSEFARQKFIEGGLPEERILVKPNFVDPDPGAGSGQGGYALYVGRLSVEKGLDTLVKAWKQMKIKTPLKIVGEGPLAQRLADETSNMPHITWLGRKSIQDTYELMGEAKFLVFPSEWYETFGRVAVEAFAKGTPVIGADIGAIAELIDHKRTGLKFCPGNPADLAAQIEWLLTHPLEYKQMRHEARAEFEANYTMNRNYHRLMEIYELTRRRASC